MDQGRATSPVVRPANTLVTHPEGVAREASQKANPWFMSTHEMRAFYEKQSTVPHFLFHSLFGESYKVTDLLTASSPNASRDIEWKPDDGIPLEVSDGMDGR